MPEGDTIYRTAVALRKVLLGKEVQSFETNLDDVQLAMTRLWPAGKPSGCVVQAVEARGKHLLIVFRQADDRADGRRGRLPHKEAIKTPERLAMELFAGDTVLHTHLRMTGSWHIYRPGEAWGKPTNYMKVAIHTANFVAPCFSAPLVELLSAREAARHRDLGALGPDAITTEFNAMEARRRLRRLGDIPIGVALMDQHAMAGVGNVFKSEILFIRRVSPFVEVSNLSDEALDGLICEAHRLLTLNTERGIRRTMFHLNERQRLWAYGRSGEACWVCGTKILMRRQGLDGRSTYYCPACQGV